MTGPLALGLDLGATNSRALIVDADGQRLGSGQAPGGNPTAEHVPDALAAIAAAIRAALGDIPPERIGSAAIGMAGVGRLKEPAVTAQFDTMWQELGLTCHYQPLSDAVVGFAAGTSAPDGTLLLAGTGAIAVDIRDHQPHRTADGHGWLLGDLGSGFWLGREAVRAALGYLDGWAPHSELTGLVLRELLGEASPPPSRDLVNTLINKVRSEPEVRLARFARTVLEAAAGSDATARDIATEAARHLVRTASQVRPDDDPRSAARPLVLAGSLLTADTVIAAEIRAVAA
ncbi:MAG: N-acetylglucosamine kinase, partial [Micromonosporaceae bacterium]